MFGKTTSRKDSRRVWAGTEFAALADTQAVIEFWSYARLFFLRENFKKHCARCSKEKQFNKDSIVA